MPQPEPAGATESNGNGHDPAPADNAVDAAMAASTTPDIEADVEQIRNRGDLTETEREILIQARRGQGRYRQQVMELAGNRCAVTGCSVDAVLEACHLKPWKISTDPERRDPENGLCLIANIHRLYDRGLISFDDEGLMRFSECLSQEDRMSLALEGQMRIKSPLTAKQKAFLKLHRRGFPQDV
jgi:putative restriction endonuclease